MALWGCCKSVVGVLWGCCKSVVGVLWRYSSIKRPINQ